jgi:anaerobic ribonucleoside-triphosphate reductase activating protein
MIKYLGQPTITFAEFPDEIALVFTITNCPNNCFGCSEPEVRQDIGEELSDEVLRDAIKRHPGISLVGFLGGDADHDAIGRLCLITKTLGLKTGFYSGWDSLDLSLIGLVDYYKIGRWIMPTGPVETWSAVTCGPITFPFSNQLMFKRVDDQYVNITEKFRKHKINNLEKEVIVYVTEDTVADH